jgi:hypothetical protein
MAEKNPFIHAYGESQGRQTPGGWTATDGDFVYVLGDENLATFDFFFNDYVEVKQDLDLAGINMLRVDSRIIQPAMPVERNVAVNPSLVHTAVLQRGHVTQSLNLRTNTLAYQVNPGSETQLKEPYSLPANAVLRIEVDGGGDFDIAFPASPPVMTLTAAEIVTIINDALTLGAVPAEARVGWDADDPTVIITADSTGKTATFEVKDYPGPSPDANVSLGFFQKVARPLATDTKIYGGDDLSAIDAPDAHFTLADLGLPLRVTGATADPGNNITNHIAAILEPSVAVLKLPVTAEPVGFDAEIRACLWEISLHVDGTEVFAKQISSNRTVDTNDIAANVSKLTGSYEVLFRLKLRAA